MTDPIYNQSNIATPGNITAANIFAQQLTAAMSQAAAQAVSTGAAAILIPAGFSVVRVSAAAATTGASLPLGTLNGQILILIVTSAAANTITMAAAGTSNVAGGTTVVLAGLEAHTFVWDAVGALWYVVGPVAN